MRVFICSYSWFSLAIPMDCVSSIFLHSDNLIHKVDFNAENSNMHISLPLLLNCPDANVKHGIILKDGNNNDSTENKVILFSTAVESEKDISPEKIYPLPKILGVIQSSLIFSGIFFNNRGGAAPDGSGAGGDKNTKELILLLNPHQLVKNIHKELIT
jgi:hypothetical protein